MGVIILTHSVGCSPERLGSQVAGLILVDTTYPIYGKKPLSLAVCYASAEAVARTASTILLSPITTF